MEKRADPFAEGARSRLICRDFPGRPDEYHQGNLPARETWLNIQLLHAGPVWRIKIFSGLSGAHLNERRSCRRLLRRKIGAVFCHWCPPCYCCVGTESEQHDSLGMDLNDVESISRSRLEL